MAAAGGCRVDACPHVLPARRSPAQHTPFMALTLLSELNSVAHLARKLLGMACAGADAAGGAAAASAAAALAATDRATFVLFR